MGLSRTGILKGFSAAVLAPATLVHSESETPADRHAPCPDPIYEKPPAFTEAGFNSKPIKGVAAAHINDFAPCGFTGPFKPSPPHADPNPRKAVVVRWKDFDQGVLTSSPIYERLRPSAP